MRANALGVADMKGGNSIGCGACQTIVNGPQRIFVVTWETPDGLRNQAFCSAKCATAALKGVKK